MPMSETTRLALVTGAAQGLGRAIAERLARCGRSVILCDSQYDATCSVARELTRSGASVIALHVDISDEQSVARLYAEVQQRFGRLDILVNNAGIAGSRQMLENLSLGDWESVIRVNLTGTFLMSRGAIPLMRQRKWGRIVNVSSLAARARTGEKKSHYAASKAGVIGLSRVLAEEVGHDGITVNCVAPSRTLTPMTLETGAGTKEYFDRAIALTALGRLAEPKDAANAVAFLCSDEASFLTGVVIDVNGGSFMA